MPGAEHAATLVLDALLEADPARLVAIGSGPAADACKAFVARRPAVELRRVATLAELDSVGGSYDLGVVGDVVGTWPAAAARALLGALRDRYCRCILLLAPAGAWPLAEYLALGFERRAEAAGAELFAYHADRANPEREWNNAEQWANPENFRRYRW